MHFFDFLRKMLPKAQPPAELVPKASRKPRAKKPAAKKSSAVASKKKPSRKVK